MRHSDSPQETFEPMKQTQQLLQNIIVLKLFFARKHDSLISLSSANNDYKIIPKCLLQPYFGVQVLLLLVNQEGLVCILSEGKYLTKRLSHYI